MITYQITIIVPEGDTCLGCEWLEINNSGSYKPYTAYKCGLYKNTKDVGKFSKSNTEKCSKCKKAISNN